MPEGPTIHRIAQDQTRLLGGKRVAVSSPQGRFAEGARLIDGRRLDRIAAFGKHLLYYFAGGRVLQVHLGLYGKFRVYDDPAPEPQGAVRVRMRAGQYTVDLNGPNQCRVIDADQAAALLARLGPDPLDPQSDSARAWRQIEGRRVAIGQLLMDQSVISGIGNIYRAELLWMIRLHPRTPGAAMRKTEFNALWKLAQKWMRVGVELNRIVTKPLKTDTPPDRLRPEQRFNIYKQRICPRCGAEIETFPLAGRKVYACGGCQELRTA